MTRTRPPEASRSHLRLLLRRPPVVTTTIRCCTRPPNYLRYCVLSIRLLRFSSLLGLLLLFFFFSPSSLFPALSDLIVLYLSPTRLCYLSLLPPPLLPWNCESYSIPRGGSAGLLPVPRRDLVTAAEETNQKRKRKKRTSLRARQRAAEKRPNKRFPSPSTETGPTQYSPSKIIYFNPFHFSKIFRSIN
ncbi:uncharacterized protein BO72DRAFT_270421 [Aspergillus fijiensis CBS 313.89]|uniref:Uncharacterized protein n=1 Tax=Aspergillus fijiensis CBS 313.89 TaxID=1448319 RepID=A0A8G1VTY3_9EURO|nr:uncharacterized protein BO72DRAFT_270421 [Aspergillus fijiensis CBS 313.89]RAK72572.1 hypothetical protein BO72DRAFT_270421 [Aspergillus fijiensis CBS 313.89]